MSAPRETGSGLPWLDYQVARAASARPTGVPLTADNVADAEHCTDAYGVRYMALPSGAWWCEAPSLACGYIGRDVLLTQAASRGTVVTKWREKP